jgi:hypothetical protein
MRSRVITVTTLRVNNPGSCVCGFAYASAVDSSAVCYAPWTASICPASSMSCSATYPPMSLELIEM